MSVAKNVEFSASSRKGFEDAIDIAIERISETVKNVEGAWVKEQKVVVTKGEVTSYRVTLIVSFVLEN